MLATFRASMRGFRDLFSHLFRNMVLSLAWWLCVLTVILAPPATLALFWSSNPVRRLGDDPPGVYELLAYGRDNFFRSWKLALATVPLILVLVYSFWFYTSESGAITLLSPVTLVALVTLLGLTTQVFAWAAITGDPAGLSIKSGLKTSAMHLFNLFLFALFTSLITFVSSFLILPLVLVVPPLVAAMSDRYQLAATGEKTLDPNTPTAERILEGKGAKKRSFLSRFFR